jgi:hypothetical protein
MNTISLDFKHKTKYDELKKRYRAIEEVSCTHNIIILPFSSLFKYKGK